MLLAFRDIMAPFGPLLHFILPGIKTDDENEREQLRMMESEKHDMASTGLTWFNSFEEIHAWQARDADPVQRASMPLFIRPDNDATGPEPKLIVVHEPYFGYLDHEVPGVVGVMEEKFSMSHLQSVETFVYATKRLVSIPPPGWTNLMHKNGVKVLGTLYVGRKSLDKEELLQLDIWDSVENSRQYPAAVKLAKMAKTYGFDGWMVSIDTGFARCISPASIVEFLEQLRKEVHDAWVSHYGARTGSVTQIVW